MSPSTTSTTEVPRMALLFTFPVKEQASRMFTRLGKNTRWRKEFHISSCWMCEYCYGADDDIYSL